MDSKRRFPLPTSARARTGAVIAAIGVVVVVAAALLGGNAALAGLPWVARVAATSTPAAPTATATATALPTPSPTTGPTVLPATGGAWPMYAASNGHSGYNSVEARVRPFVPPWHVAWVAPDWTSLTAQVVAANNLAYIGSWDGYERAIPLNSPNPVWKDYLGVTSASCKPYTLGKDPGVASTPDAVTVNGKPMLFVGGGDAQLYALDALTGAIKWRTRLGSSPDHFIWSSPVVSGDGVFVGLASTADCPMVAGQVFKLDVMTGAIVSTFTAVPQGCTGGEVWDAPTLDDAAGVLYVATGSAGSCAEAEPYADAVVALSTANLGVVGSWQTPASEQIGNGGFRGAPTLFVGEQGHAVHLMVGAGNKNGIYYAFDRTRVSAGPMWQQRIAVGGGCLNYLCKQASIATAAWDGRLLYVGGGATTIGGTSCAGSIQAIEPGFGKPFWQTCLQYGPVTAALTLANSGTNEVGIICAGDTVVFFTASNGAPWFEYEDPEFQNFYSPTSVSNGVTWWPNVDGGVHQNEMY